MPEPRPEFETEAYTDTIRHETSKGTVVECQTTIYGSSGLAEQFSRTRGMDVVVSPSSWFFRGAEHVNAASSTSWLLTMMVNSDPDAVGLFEVLGRTGTAATGPGQPPEETDPFVVLTIGAPDAEVTQQEVTDYSYQIVSKANAMLPGLQSDLQLPLPPQVK